MRNHALSQARGEIFLAWLDPVDGWENAVLGNFGGTNSFAGVGAWTDTGAPGLADDLGRWGIDPSLNQVWAVLNHNSQFAVLAVPEPSSFALAAFGLLGLALVSRRRRK